MEMMKRSQLTDPPDLSCLVGRFWEMAFTFTGLKLQGSLGRFGKTTTSDIEGYTELPDGKVSLAVAPRLLDCRQVKAHSLRLSMMTDIVIINIVQTSSYLSPTVLK